jgi:hypothetical protein
MGRGAVSYKRATKLHDDASQHHAYLGVETGLRSERGKLGGTAVVGSEGGSHGERQKSESGELHDRSDK